MPLVRLAAVLCLSMGACSSGERPAKTLEASGPARAFADPAAVVVEDSSSTLETGFVAPDVRTRIRAAGNRAGLPDHLRRAFAPSSPTFTPLLAPTPGDWLAEHVEHGQTYDQYVASHPNRPDDQRHTIYLLPIGDLGPDAPSLERFTRFARGYFHLDVEVLDPITLAETGARTRVRDDGDDDESDGDSDDVDAKSPTTDAPAIQAHAGDIIDYMKDRVPIDAFCVIALTATDLYPRDAWRFVFGMASLRERVGVYSLARYHPSFYDEEDHYPNPEAWVLRRSFKVMAHEIGHMFGIKHCIYYECAMSGTNHLDESDRRPLHLCPVCLRKLHHAVGFDPAERYQQLSQLYRSVGLGPEAEWARARHETLQSGP